MSTPSRYSRSVLALAVMAVALATPAVSAPKLSPEEQLQKMIAGRTAGKPMDCVSQTPMMDSQKIEGIGLVYRQGRTLYVNRFENGCPSLTSYNVVITRTPSTQLCRGDIARLVDLTTRIESGSCIFGTFTPYTKAK